MTKIIGLLIAVFLISVACQRSQFSTTIRQYKNGKVSYSNRYKLERDKISLIKFPGNNLNHAGVIQKTTIDDNSLAQNHPDPDIQKIAPVTFNTYENLIASTSKEPTISILNENQLIAYNDLNIPHERCQGGDTIVLASSLVKIDTIPPDTRKTEKLGLAGFILSFLGFVPIIGIPFAIIGVIFGARSLRKIKRFPTLYKGKGFGKASLILGILAIIFNIIIVIVVISAAAAAASSSMSACSSVRIRV